VKSSVLSVLPIVGLGVAFSLPACVDGPRSEATPPPLVVHSSAIRNGTRDPRALALSEGQILSLGWLFSVPDGANSNFCTATLINGSTVVTASHCTEGSTPDTIGFGIGLLPTEPVATFRVARKFEHPELDLAVLRLSEDALDRVPELVPVPPNTQRLDNTWLGSDLQAGGYGETYDRTRYGRWFATVVLAELDATDLVVDGQGIMGICYGDSGGPVMADLGDGPVVLGVESYGDASCVDQDHLTRLDVAVEFIAGIAAGEIPADPCEGLDYLGRCNGATAEWCDEGTFQSLDCALEGRRCDYVDDQTGYYCTDGEPCGDIGRSGTCRGDVFVRCRNGSLVEEDCEASGLICRLVGGGARCSDPDLVPVDTDTEIDASPPEVEVDAAPPPAPQVPDAGLPGEVPGPEVGTDAGAPGPNGLASGDEKSKATGCAARPSNSAGPPWAWVLGIVALSRRRRRVSAL
jgi:MYXO-CTERM domain-containing protein